MSTTSSDSTHAPDDAPADRPLNPQVERFLEDIEGSRSSARRARWIGLGVGAVIGGVALLTAIGIVPVAAEDVVLSASAVVAGLALGKSSRS